MFRLFYKFFICTFIALILSNALTAQAALTDITRIYHSTPHIDQFEVCSGGGCVESHQVALTVKEWKKIAQIFSANTSEENDANAERKYIEKAVGMFEKIVGEKTNTSTDRAGTFDNSAYSGQMDCNDEAINTTTYLRLMVQEGLIKLHSVEDMRTRNFFFTGWPHTTAVIHENASTERFAVDSWFYDNASPATIVPFRVWKSVFIPNNSPIMQKREAKTLKLNAN